jgi:hypothetical protein
MVIRLSCIEYALVDTDRGYVIREAIACSELELELVKQLIELVNKKFNININVKIKKKQVR